MFIKGQTSFGVITKNMPQYSQTIAKPFSAVTGQAKLDTKTLTKKNNNLRHYRKISAEDQEIASPLLVTSGALKINPGGAMITKITANSVAEFKTNEIAKRMVVAGKRARNFLIAKQFTELEFLDYEVFASEKSDLMDPFVLFGMASIYNTNYFFSILRQLLQAQGIIESLVNYIPDVEAQASKMVATLSRRKYITSINSFISALSKLPVSKECIDIISNATGYEKANDSYDTAFHYVPYDYSLSVDQIAAFNVNIGGQPQSLVVPQLTTYKLLPIFTPEVVTKLLLQSDSITTNEMQLLDPNATVLDCTLDNAMVKYQDALIKFIDTCTMQMTQLIVQYTPYQTAMTVLGDVADLSIMSMNSDPVKLAGDNIIVRNTANAINYQAMITNGLTATEDANNATINMVVPTFSNYNVLPIYNTSGVLNMVTTDEGYAPIVDISNCSFQYMIVIASMDSLKPKGEGESLLLPYQPKMSVKSSSGYGFAIIATIDDPTSTGVPTLSIKGDPKILTPISFIGKYTYIAQVVYSHATSGQPIKTTYIVNENFIGSLAVSYNSIFTGLSNRAPSIIGLKYLG